MINKIKNIIRRIFKVNNFPESEKGKLEYVFTFRGKKYYHYIDSLQMPYRRALILQSIYAEFEQKMTFKELNTLISSALAYFNNEKMVNMTKVYDILKLIEARSKITFEVETALRLAACYYIAEDEDVNYTDEILIEKKVNDWKVSSSAVNFFLNWQYRELVKHSEFSEEDIRNSTVKTIQLMIRHLEAVADTLPPAYFERKKQELLSYSRMISTS